MVDGLHLVRSTGHYLYAFFQPFFSYRSDGIYPVQGLNIIPHFKVLNPLVASVTHQNRSIHLAANFAQLRALPVKNTSIVLYVCESHLRYCDAILIHEFPR